MPLRETNRSGSHRVPTRNVEPLGRSGARLSVGAHDAPSDAEPVQEPKRTTDLALRRHLLFSLGVLILPMAMIGAYVRIDETVTARGRIDFTALTPVTARISARIERVLCREGDMSHSGRRSSSWIAKKYGPSTMSWSSVFAASVSNRSRSWSCKGSRSSESNRWSGPESTTRNRRSPTNCDSSAPSWRLASLSET